MRCLLMMLVMTVAGCNSQQNTMVCDDSLALPPGFCAEVFHDGIGKRARHIAVRDNGDVYIAKRRDGGGLIALRDTDNDGRSDAEKKLHNIGGSAVVIREGWLYFSTPTKIMRYPFVDDELLPSADAQIIVQGFDSYSIHASKALAFDEAGHMYVNIGAPSNACQEPSRTAGVPGLDPCPLLERSGGVWRYLADRSGQDAYKDGTLYATGIRNGLAMTWSQHTGKLYLVQHGRDQLHELWPDLFSEQQRAELPAEEFFEINEGDDFGWPYCFYDHVQQRKVLSPEYGGDGSKIGRCDQYRDPVAAFPGHWAPNDMVFYEHQAFPEKYHHGAFIAFHGSWNRQPFDQKGYQVTFQAFRDGKAFGDYETFIAGFEGKKSIKAPGQASSRPTGLAVDNDGALWISDSRKGRIWRVTWVGE